MFWETVGDDVWRLVREAFETSMYNPKDVEILIVLIPKNDGAKHLKDFRPISLCFMIYKLISEVLVNRLRPFLSNLASPMQSSFIPGRETTNNAIIHSFLESFAT